MSKTWIDGAWKSDRGIINLACDQSAAHRKYVFAQCAAGRSTTETPAASIFTTEWTNTANAITSMTLLPLSGLDYNDAF